MRFMTENGTTQNEGESNDDKFSSPLSITHESIIVQSEYVTLYVFEFDQLKSYLEDHQIISNALFSYISHELREKLSISWEMKTTSDKEKLKLEQLAVDYLMDGLKD